MTDHSLYVLLIGLAVWRVSRMLVHEEGPMDMFGRLRDFAGISYDENSNIIAENVLAKVLTCVDCTSVWVSFAFALLYFIDTRILFVAMFPLSVSAVATIINQRL